MDLSRDMVMGHEFCCRDRRLRTGRDAAAAIRARRSAAAGGASTATGCRPSATRTTCPGGYGQYMRLMEAAAAECRMACSAEQAALTEPMAVGLHAVEKARLDRHDVPLVIGCGPVGLGGDRGARLKDVGADRRGRLLAAPAPARRDARRRHRGRSRRDVAVRQLARGRRWREPGRCARRCSVDSRPVRCDPP